MGLFLQTAIVKDGDMGSIQSCLSEIAREYPDMNLNAQECVYHPYDRGVGILFNDHAAGFDPLAEALCAKLNATVLMLYIYDDDFWGYFLCENGREIDRFSPLPDYFDEDEEAVARYAGTPGQIARCFDVAEEEISRYIVRWSEDILDSDACETAYEDDESTYGDCWQMADFMRKLGFPFDALEQA